MRLAAEAHGSPYRRLPEVRARRRASGFRSDGELSRWRTRQFSLRREQVSEVRRWLDNYQKLKSGLEAICELNHDLLRPDAGARQPRGKNRD